MRFDRLFDDLEGQADAAQRDDLAAEVADRTRSELARVAWVDRVRAAAGTRLELRTAGAGRLGGEVGAVGAGWMMLALDRGAALVRTDAVTEVRGLGVSVAPAAGEVDRRRDVGHPLRALARDRSWLTIALTDGRLLQGRIARVGMDFIDLAGPRSAPDTGQWRTVPLAALAVVQWQ